MKILVIKLGALGDFVIAIGSILSVLKKYPDAEVTLMTHKSLIPIAKQMGVFSHYIVDNRAAYCRIPTQLRLMKEVTAGDFDLVLNFQERPRTIKVYYPIFRWLIPHTFSWVNTRMREEHVVHKKHRWSRGKEEIKPFEFKSEQTDLSFLHGENKHFDMLPERFVTLIPGCSPGHPHKRWPVSHFCDLAKKLAENNIHSVIIGTKAEEEEINTISQATPMAVNMMSKTSLLDLPDLAHRALATVGNDTGPTHITALSGRPMITVFAARKKPCSVKGKYAINIVSPGAIGEVSVEQVWEKLTPYISIDEEHSSN